MASTDGFWLAVNVVIDHQMGKKNHFECDSNIIVPLCHLSYSYGVDTCYSFTVTIWLS